MTALKMVPLTAIQPDPGQPRKMYDETAMAELAESVKEKGILQPILVRPIGTSEAYIKKDPAAPMDINIRRVAGYTGPEFLLVCGERRFRASKVAGLNEIPAVVRELSDDEALELQIIENLQRKDVHPMEEAVAFKSLLENKTRPLTAEEIAARVGKSVFYVRQRIKLNALTKQWQDVFYSNHLGLADAFRVCQIATKEQDYLFSQLVRKNQLADPHYSIDISDWHIRELRRELNSAPFSRKDETLNPKMGPCTTCAFNSAVASLFPDAAKNPVCNNATCYNVKAAVSFERKLKEVTEDPGVVLIYNYMSTKEDRDLLTKLKKDGHTIYETGMQCQTNGSPNKKDIESGKYVKGFYIGGHEKGRTTYVELRKNTPGKTNSKAAEEKIKSGKASTADIDAEITRIQDREKRSKELDLEKVHAKIVDQLKTHHAFKQPATAFEKTDRLIMIHLLIHEAGDYSVKDDIRKALGIKDATYSSAKGYQFDYLKQFEKITDDQLAFIIRKIALSKYNVSLPQNVGGTVLRSIADYLKVDSASLEKEQAAIAQKRGKRVTERLEALRLTKKSLQQEKPKAAAEKGTTKTKGKAKK